jgi:hypothetical protein
MKAKPFRKGNGSHLPLKCPPKRARGIKTPLRVVTRPSPIEFSGGIDDEEALVVAESLDEREKRG